MGRPFRVLLDDVKVYACASCRTHLSSGDNLVSRHFHSRTGRAYLFHTVYNVVGGPHEQRMMTTGRHLVCDIFCADCMACVGWQYVVAYEESQKYKEGMCILERALVVDFDKTAPGITMGSQLDSANGAPPGSSGSSGGSGGGSGGSRALHAMLMAQGPGVRALEVGSGGMVMYADEETGSEEEEDD